MALKHERGTWLFPLMTNGQPTGAFFSVKGHPALLVLRPGFTKSDVEHHLSFIGTYYFYNRELVARETQVNISRELKSRIVSHIINNTINRFGYAFGEKVGRAVELVDAADQVADRERDEVHFLMRIFGFLFTKSSDDFTWITYGSNADRERLKNLAP